MSQVAYVETGPDGLRLLVHGVEVRTWRNRLQTREAHDKAAELNAAASASRPSPVSPLSNTARLREALATLQTQIQALDTYLTAPGEIDPEERALLDRQMTAMCTHAEVLEQLLARRERTGASYG